MAAKVFLLLDEPGLTLHGLAQADLLRSFTEKLEPHHQIVYSTHSPFMVPHDNIMASRIVEDLVEVDARGRAHAYGHDGARRRAQGQGLRFPSTTRPRRPSISPLTARS